MIFLPPMIITGFYAENTRSSGSQKSFHCNPNLHSYSYAYLTRQAKENPKFPKPQVLVPTHGDNNSRTLRSHSKSSSNSSLNQQASITFANHQPSSSTS